MPNPIKPMSGRYGKLTVICGPIVREGVVWYRFKCNCGCEKEIRSSQVRYGRARSCGAKSCREYSVPVKIRYLESSIVLMERKLAKKRSMLEKLKTATDSARSR